ncbi:hypothetical protein U472_02570 [Orenia metallireducens]|uniref:Uncharacterized protein n=1 Tax=Orenia metallireducens TaxID=1413210 RepID=A0A1C0ACK0_9FIRM|nr:hypothetical protein [Orenia metallireducens]OCL28097.1 hypothetical protein U472_02570 [Orenia metallireducens]
MSHIIALFLQFIPEETALAFLATVFLKVEIDKKTVLVIGLISGVAVYLFRMLPVTFGFHTIFLILLDTVLLNYFYQRRVLDCFSSILKPFILLFFCEIITANILHYISDKSIEELIRNPLIKTIVVLPQVILLFLVGIVILWMRDKKEQRYDL